MPVAVVIAASGDVRDALGLYLAGHGWTALPADPEPGAVLRAIGAAAPDLVAVDFRGAPDGALAAVRALAEAGAPAPHLFNLPDQLRAAVAAASPEAVEVTEDGGGLPRAPGVPGPPH